LGDARKSPSAPLARETPGATTNGPLAWPFPGGPGERQPRRDGARGPPGTTTAAADGPLRRTSHGSGPSIRAKVDEELKKAPGPRETGEARRTTRSRQTNAAGRDRTLLDAGAWRQRPGRRQNGDPGSRLPNGPSRRRPECSRRCRRRGGPAHPAPAPQPGRVTFRAPAPEPYRARGREGRGSWHAGPMDGPSASHGRTRFAPRGLPADRAALQRARGRLMKRSRQ